MKRIAIIASVLLMFFFTHTVFASQEEDQELCVEKALPLCIQKCQKENPNEDCQGLCTENIKNQCVYAGE